MKYIFFFLAMGALDASLFLADFNHQLHLNWMDHVAANWVLLAIGWITHYFRVA